jgi:hypothetical protein
MSILSTLLDEFHAVFPRGVRGQLHWSCFLLTLKALLIPLAPARAASLRRVIAVVFGVTLSRSAYYRFMASARLPWKALWVRLWRGVPSPLTDGRLILGLDDSINPKTGRKIFGCQTTFDHAAKPNQSAYPWAQTILLLGLLKRVHGRWACIPWAFAWYLRLATLRLGCQRLRGRAIGFETKFAQATRLLRFVAAVFPKIPILVVADSWFGNNGLWQPMRQALGPQVDLLARLRVNTALYDRPPAPSGKRGRPPKYGSRLGTVKELAARLRPEARCETLQLYGRQQPVQFVERLVMLKTLKRCVRIVWVFRHAHWIALFTTDLTLSAAQIIEFYGARWKLESGFKEIKQDIGSAQTQARTPEAVDNHLNFCLLATALTWIFGDSLTQAPDRRYATARRTQYTFADLRRAFAKALTGENFEGDCTAPSKPTPNSIADALLRLVA